MFGGQKRCDRGKEGRKGFGVDGEPKRVWSPEGNYESS